MTRASTIPSPPIPGAPDASGALLAAWPRDRPLAMLASHGDSPFARFSFAASPVSERQLRGPETIEILRRELAGPVSGPHPAAERLPTGRGHFVMLGYDLFRHLEPTAASPAPPLDDRQWPDAILLRCEGGLLHHGGRTEVRGDPALVPDLEPRVLPPPIIDGLHPDPTDVEYRRDVGRVIEHVHAGDCFQVNLAQRFGTRFRGSVRSLAALAFEAAAPRYGAMLECGPGRAIVSMSPELFLETTPGTDGVAVRTRPIKGTRPSSRSVDELERSEKDAAELHMIVDLMRNDLGRVCRLGSVRVSQPRTIESHPTVHHGVAEITGILRPELGIADLVLAAFPPGSVTGAPKVQAMRIIDELEPVRRGPYCGAVGWIDDSGYATLNVAIRTITATGTPLDGCGELDGRLDYFAGCGIVAESDPEAEYRESLDKTEVFRRAIENASTGSTNH
ncbi:MAG: hypothetical protein CMJ54_09265 [Planctomycetaceae bacterium]|nr:hypothetical protein [Planctomycetaceae bacterium]